MPQQVKKNLSKAIKSINDHIDQLAGTIPQVCLEDLTGLGQIHEQLAHLGQDCTGLDDQVFCKALLSLTEELTDQVEKLIIGSCPTPRPTFQQIIKTITSLLQSCRTDTGLPSVQAIEQLYQSLASSSEQEPQPPQTRQQPSDQDQEKPSPAAQDQQPQRPESDLYELQYKPEPLIIRPQELEYAKGFVAESNEHIDNLESLLLEIEQQPDDLDKINELFRPFHTIKGVAGFLNMGDITALTHQLETLLDLARKGKLKITEQVIDIVFDALDVIKAQLAAIAQYLVAPDGRPIPQPPIASLLQRLAATSAGRPLPQPAGKPPEPAPGKKLGQILIEDQKISPEVVDFALQQQRQQGDKPIGQFLRDSNAVTARDINKALRRQKSVKDLVIRVDTKKLDDLVDMIGEMVIAQTMVQQDQLIRSNHQSAARVELVSKIISNVQETAMFLRMVPIAQTFQKMARVVRDTSHKAGKQVQLIVEGEDTRLDKNVIQEIADPLLHMIRNAVDHGIESPEQRIAAGKDPKGTVRLLAYHQDGSIVVQVCDDGRGLDPQAIFKKAVEKGMAPADAQLDDREKLNLIMTAGFSTAQQVTDISGRGVGLDVVKRNVERLRGRVDIRSCKGQGSTFTMRLPLTLAVIDGMIVQAGDERYIIPTVNIIQALHGKNCQVHSVQGGRKLLKIRDMLCPLLSLGQLFGIDNAKDDPTEGMVVILQADAEMVGIIVDKLIGQQQVVIKNLGREFGHIKGISGGTILGDGKVGLILEPASLLSIANSAT